MLEKRSRTRGDAWLKQKKAAHDAFSLQFVGARRRAPAALALVRCAR